MDTKKFDAMNDNITDFFQDIIRFIQDFYENFWNTFFMDQTIFKIEFDKE
jgi:hypothetical protein